MMLLLAAVTCGQTSPNHERSLMQTYVFRNGHWVDKTTGKRMQTIHKGVCAPRYIISDIEPHKAPDGRIVRSRSDLADVRARTGHVLAERVGDATKMPKGEYNPASDKWREWEHTTKSKLAKGAGLDAESLNTEAQARKVFGSLRDRVAAKERAKA
jgi:hypothetical protein